MASCTDRIAPRCPKCNIPLTCGRVASRVRYAKCCSAEERFWAKVEKGEGCWTWRGAVTSQHGYGNAAWKGHYWGAHKVAWTITNGPVPDGLCVLHKCDNRVCVNPSHLYIGTKKDNSRDKAERGRDPTRGEGNQHAKLTEEDALYILSRKPQKRVRGLTNALAQKYGVHPGAITAIWSRRYWKHLPEPK